MSGSCHEAYMSSMQMVQLNWTIKKSVWITNKAASPSHPCSSRVTLSSLYQYLSLPRPHAAVWLQKGPADNKTLQKCAKCSLPGCSFSLTPRTLSPPPKPNYTKAFTSETEATGSHLTTNTLVCSGDNLEQRKAEVSPGELNSNQHLPN